MTPPCHSLPAALRWRRGQSSLTTPREKRLLIPARQLPGSILHLYDELPPRALHDHGELARVDLDVDHHAPHLSVPGDDVSQLVLDVVDGQARDADVLALTPPPPPSSPALPNPSGNTRSGLMGRATESPIRTLVTPGATRSSAKR